MVDCIKPQLLTPILLLTRGLGKSWRGALLLLVRSQISPACIYCVLYRLLEVPKKCQALSKHANRRSGLVVQALDKNLRDDSNCRSATTILSKLGQIIPLSYEKECATVDG